MTERVDQEAFPPKRICSLLQTSVLSKTFMTIHIAFIPTHQLILVEMGSYLSMTIYLNSVLERQSTSALSDDYPHALFGDTRLCLCLDTSFFIVLHSCAFLKMAN